MDEKIIALVTGASRGIGRATAVELARAGYYVVINYKAGEAAASETLAQIQASGAAGEIRRFDVADAAQVKEALAGIIEEHKRIDVLVNNAGVTRDGLFLMMGEEDWHTVINTTLNGFYNVTKPVLREMIRKNAGPLSPYHPFLPWFPIAARPTTPRPKPGSTPQQVRWPKKSPASAFASMRSRRAPSIRIC